ncbi:MAG: HEAT repeat domain-containing protein [Nitrospirales bacterium]
MYERNLRQIFVILIFFVAIPFGMASADIEPSAHVIFVQAYESPPEVEFPDIPQATPAPEVLSLQDRDRLESLVPLLEGRQELWAMGEFVHFGKHSVPFVIKALSMPGPRIRYNAIETLSMIKDPSPVSALLDVAKSKDEISRVRTHAIRVATRLDWMKVFPAIKEMVKDENSTIRRTAVFEARRVRQKEILPILIETIGDPEQFVSLTALESFRRLTGFSGAPHNWEISTQEDRKKWSQEWWTWFKENESRFGPPQNAQPPRTASPTS